MTKTKKTDPKNRPVKYTGNTRLVLAVSLTFALIVLFVALVAAPFGVSS